jgi:hypothetical protein
MYLLRCDFSGTGDLDMSIDCYDDHRVIVVSAEARPGCDPKWDIEKAQIVFLYF